VTELVAAPDVEAALVAHIRSVLSTRNDSAHVGTTVPNPRPTRLVRVTRKGGPRRNIVTDSPLVVVEAWDVDTVASFDLGSLVEAIVLASSGSFIGTKSVWVNDAASVGGLSFFPDPDTALPRYQFTVQLFTNCEVL
jgi:hypothetical protein